MSIYDIWGGGQSEYFTDWSKARDFMIFTGIVNSNSLTDEEKVLLQDLEQDAFENSSGQWSKSEREEIAEYYNYMNNNSRALTNNTDFLNLVANLAGASADTADPDDELELDKTATQAAKTLGFVALGALVLYVLAKD